MRVAVLAILFSCLANAGSPPEQNQIFVQPGTKSVPLKDSKFRNIYKGTPSRALTYSLFSPEYVFFIAMSSPRYFVVKNGICSITPPLVCMIKQ